MDTLEQATADRSSAKTQSLSTIDCFDPASRKPLGQVSVDSPEAVVQAVERARAAQRAWGRASLATRRQLLRQLLEHILEHADEICRAVVADSGKTRENAMLGEIWPVCEKLRWTIRNGEKHLRPERVSSGLMVHKKAAIEFHPLGVVGVICPWNYPFQNIFGPAIPALMAGNAVVVKVSEWSAWSSLYFQQIFDQILTAAGFSTDLVRIVNGYAATGKALVSSGVDSLVFTGSVENGRRVLAEAAANLTPVILELGGKDAMIVCDDADLERSVHAAVNGVFINAGQNCMSAERLLVFDGIFDDFRDRVVALTKRLRQGASSKDELVDVGAIVSPIQLDLIERMVDEAVAGGARVLVGGKRALSERGQYFEPTILTDVTPTMTIMQEELFGPVMVLHRVRDEEEALRVANGTRFGLSSTVMSRNPKRARRIAEQIVAGSTCINDFGLCYMVQDLPFGGVKNSGFGRLNGRDGLRACTNIKATLSDRLPIHRASRLFPVRRGDYGLALDTIRLIYDRRVARRASALVNILKHTFSRSPRSR
ncbi:MAG TPA: aldehyde dehydrogenase family protein [Myxococcota bacterium]